MNRHLALITILACHFCLASDLEAQKFEGAGSIMRNSISSSRATDSAGEPIIGVGDLIVINVNHPSSAGSIYVSIHAEVYDQQNQRWTKVQAAANEFESKYKSQKYGDLRDYFFVSPSQEDNIRKVAFFLPYPAFGLEEGKHSIRYKLRLWDRNNNEIDSASAATESEQLSFSKKSIRYVRVESKTRIEFVVDENGNRKQVEKIYQVEQMLNPPLVETLTIE